MISVSRIIAGFFGIVLGVVMIVGAFFTSFVLAIYGVVFLVIGIVIFLNSKEDEIEQIKFKKSIKTKRGSK